MDKKVSDQERVEAFVAEHDLEAPADIRLLDLVSEVGELAKEILVASDYGTRPPDTGPGWAEELADVYFSLLCLANATGVGLTEQLAEVLEKYESRLTEGGDPGSR